MSLSELLYNVASNSIFVINASNKIEEQWEKQSSAEMH